MQASECCIIRASIAAILGWLIAVSLMWKHSTLAALMLGPFFGSGAAIAAVALFWFVSVFVPCPRPTTPTSGADQWQSSP